MCGFYENIGGFCVALFSLELDDQLAGELDATLLEEDTSRGESKQSAEALSGDCSRGRRDSGLVDCRPQKGGPAPLPLEFLKSGKKSTCSQPCKCELSCSGQAKSSRSSEATLAT